MANWFEKILPSFIRKGTTKKSTIPEGLWQSCSNCNNILYVPELESNLFVCPKCDHHIRIGARKRLEFFLDPHEAIEISKDKTPKDWLKFKDTKTYKERIDSAEKVSNEKEALLAMKGYLKKMPIVASAFEFRYMGGSMGSVVGQKFVDTVDFALENKKDKKKILDLIKKITNKAMQGEIPFSDALYERINLINLKSKHID